MQHSPQFTEDKQSGAENRKKKESEEKTLKNDGYASLAGMFDNNSLNTGKSACHKPCMHNADDRKHSGSAS